MSEIIGIDPIYVTVSDVAVSEKFYDTVMAALGFKKNRFPINDESHIQYYNRHFGYCAPPCAIAKATRCVRTGPTSSLLSV